MSVRLASGTAILAGPTGIASTVLGVAATGLQMDMLDRPALVLTVGPAAG